MRHLLTAALAAADAAARVHREWSGRIRSEEAREKTSAADFVSQVDLEAQEAAVSRIRAHFPDHLVLAEEGDDEAGRIAAVRGSGPVWIIDPLDGTTNFLHGYPAYASSVGLVYKGEPVVGAVVSPATSQRWWAARGEGAYRNGARICTSQTSELRYALVGTGFPFKLLDRLDDYTAQFARVLPASSGIRRGGSAALDLCFLAQGSLDAFWEMELSPWDVAGGLAILKEAGGAFRRVGGAPLDPLTKGSVLAANSTPLLDALDRRLRTPTPEA